MVESFTDQLASRQQDASLVGWQGAERRDQRGSDRDNISDKELVAFKKLSKNYAEASAQDIIELVKDGELLEICHDC